MTTMKGLQMCAMTWKYMFWKMLLSCKNRTFITATIATNAISFLTRARYIYIIIGPNSLDFPNTSSAGYDRVWNDICQEFAEPRFCGMGLAAVGSWIMNAMSWQTISISRQMRVLCDKENVFNDGKTVCYVVFFKKYSRYAYNIKIQS